MTRTRLPAAVAVLLASALGLMAGGLTPPAPPLLAGGLTPPAPPAAGPKPGRVFEFVEIEGEEEPGETVDLAALARGETA